ncbi:hypothetical protein LPB72_12875 [Hydrogenophaga crassostreae]|uniref:NAD(P)/FAD-dependent oxidoreductase n=1 Tax=Hydrogenophaga crassostreae TaxID=1763535 RepID=A0A162SXI0_9BURK|nr:NAD(P)-binding protein [Hydrogenophaga crassostreae]AOW14960.1 hypothetical protein LPB072_21200 [Hydrogenophaga crassostreae]OAD41412.1 hypothetical protein LPB72_12875 [Hydrogenophaga crassostreae]
MTKQATDYLIIGSGAVGLAFADTLLDEAPDVHITIVDRHGKPGGHWNDAYSFVALHQPSSFYGVNSMPLGSNRKDEMGVNKGLYELASGPEVSGYFERVMHQKLLPSGRVSYHPMSDYVGEGRFVSLLSGTVSEVDVRRRVVDASYFATQVPSTRKPRYAVAAGVRVVPPNALPDLWQKPEALPKHFTIVGAGKTAMDVGVWLLKCGARPDSISWVMPRDSWLINRQCVQPGMEFFKEVIGGQADQMEAFAAATSVDDLFARLEGCDQMLRIYPDQQPSMFHYATISKGEVALLRQIRQVVRKGHVQSIDDEGLLLDGGREPMPPGTLYIDCSASAVEQRAPQPVFQDGKMVLQLVRAPQPTFSAALIAYVEAHFENDLQKNQLCMPVPFPVNLAGYLTSTAVSTMNQVNWSQDEALRAWVRNSRLDGFGKLMASADKANAEHQAILGRLRSVARAAMGNVQKLMASASPAAH